jgi:hypothetical protein
VDLEVVSPHACRGGRLSGISFLSTRRATALFVSLVVSSILLLLLIRSGGIRETVEILQRVRLSDVGSYALLSLVGLLFRALRYRLLIRTALGFGSLPSFDRLLIITALRNALCDFIPARAGEAGYVYLLNRAGVRGATGISSLGYCAILDSAVLLGIIAFFFAASALLSSTGAGQLALDSRTLIGGLCVSVLLCAAIVAALQYLPAALRSLAQYCRRRAERNPAQHAFLSGSRLNRLAGYFEEMFDDVRLYSNPNIALRLVGITVLLRLSKYMALYTLLLAVVQPLGIGGSDLPPLLCVTAFVTAEASASLPVSGIMGFGAYEGSLGLVFAFAGLKIPSVLHVAFVVHLLSQVNDFFWAAAAAAILLVRGRQNREHH